MLGDNTFLSTALDNHSVFLTDLVTAWLDTGATALFITGCDGERVAQWPLSLAQSHADLAAPLELNGACVGKLHLRGVVNAQTKIRLQTDARLLSNLLQLEYALEEMTTNIIDQQDQLMALHQLAETIRVHAGIRQNLADLARITAQLLKTENAFMLLRNDGETPRLATFPQPYWPEDVYHALIDQLEAIPTKEQWLLQQNDGFVQQLGIPIRNLLVKKIAVRPGLALFLGAANKTDGDFQAPDLKLFSTIAEPAAANLENALLHQEMLEQTRIQTEMELAKQVQMRLWPQHTPQIAGLELAAASRPASHVGGDFYDYILNANHLLTFTLGDVSGKGMPAAILMAMLRTELRGKAKEQHGAAPEHLLSLTNECLYDDFSEVNMFATIFLGQYDCHQHILYYANDGHAPVIYRPATGSAHLLAADAPPLGVLPVNLAERYSLLFQPGDLLVITSDGFSEAVKKDGEMFGYERLLELVDQLAAWPATQLMEKMFTIVQEFSGDQSQTDDQTLLVLKRIEHDDRT